LEQSVQVSLRGYDYIEKINEDTSVDEAQKNMLNAMKPMHKILVFAFINGLQQDINNKKFSEKFTPLAKDKLVIFFNRASMVFDAQN
jgi:hypothetical protein